MFGDLRTRKPMGSTESYGQSRRRVDSSGNRPNIFVNFLLMFHSSLAVEYGKGERPRAKIG